MLTRVLLAGASMLVTPSVVAGRAVGVGVGSSAGAPGEVIAPNALEPPPTNVDQVPHPSVTTSWTVVGWPAVTRCTFKVIEAGRFVSWTVVGALVTAVVSTVGTSTDALLSRVNCSDRSWLFG
jgi:hypothetical protein